MAVASLTLSFCIVPLIGSLGELLHFQLSSLHTAASLYLPLLFAIAMFMALNRDLGARLLEPKGLILLSFICGFWLISYFYERYSPGVRMTDYDYKRIWFFVQGVLLCGFAGILASEDPRRFIPLFLRYFCLLSTGAALIYTFSYRPGQQFDRLLGEKALGVGILAAFGMVACLAVLLMELESGHKLSYPALLTLIGAILIDVAAIILSATRGAALCCLVGVVIFTWMMRKSKFLLLSVVTVVALAICLISLARMYVPEGAMSRLLRQEDGFDLRSELTHTMIGVIARNPYGKTFGYEYTLLNMDYAHNTLLQYVGEASVLSIPAVVILLSGAILNLARHRAERQVQALALFGLPVLAESFSAGSAYDPLPWFLLFLVFSLRGERRTTVPHSHLAPAPQAAAPVSETLSPPLAPWQRGTRASAGHTRPRTGTPFDWSGSHR
jgi:hypothetical protein